ncbi:MAG: glutamate--tRNA ligase, partial [Lachnospiraceae bacterium]|nr:glutamate--tRNA ligase [Lachnospiraceae bacterium]
PYVQSERVKTGVYLKYAKELIEKGEAYYCFCDRERLSGLKSVVSEDEDGEAKEITKYDKHCLHLSKEEIEANLAAGKPYVIRQNVPTSGTTTFTDAIYGSITVENEELDDMILIKSDGFPTYNFANVIDDHLMGITHVVRGNEYLSSTPKYTRLYHAFGWDEPIYIHCPLITNEEHKKLAKRSGHSSFEDLLEQGFVTEAIVNFIALLGWSPESNEEIFSLEELIREFDYRKISKSPAVFDMQKLRWMNSEYIKRMDDSQYYILAMPYIDDAVHCDCDKKMIADLVKTRIETFCDIAGLVDFFEELPNYDVAMFTHKKMKTNAENSLEVLRELLPRFEELSDYSVPAIESLLMGYIAEKGIKNGQGLWPVRTAVSGKQSTPGGAYEIMHILGKEESLRRIRTAIEKLSLSVQE